MHLRNMPQCRRRTANGMTMNDPVSERIVDNKHEQSLLARVANEDRDALGSLFRIYHPRLFKFVFRLTRSFSIADELVNDIMLVVWQKARSFRGESKVSTWIFGIAYRQTMRRVSKKKIALAPFADAEDIAAENGVNLEQEDWIRHGLHALPEVHQLTVVLVFYLGLSYEETAEVTDCPVNTVKTRMFHARKKLKKLLEESAVPNAYSDED